MSISPDIPIPPTEESSRFKGSLWRLIPTLFLVLFGGILILGWIVVSILELAAPPDPAFGVQWLRTGVPYIMLCAGSFLVVSGLSFWKRRWWRAVICMVLGYGLGCLGMWFYEKHSPNRVGGGIAPPASHTTVHAGPRTAVPGSPNG
jgi:hypothetical protein